MHIQDHKQFKALTTSMKHMRHHFAYILVSFADMDQLSMRQIAYKPGTRLILNNDVSKYNKSIRLYVNECKAMDVGAEEIRVFEAHYPENLRRIFVING